MAEKKAYAQRLAHIVKRYRFALIAAAAGLALLLWPASGRERAPAEAPAQTQTCAEPDDIARTEEKLEALLSLIEGAGEVRVMLTLRSSGERVYADEKKLTTDADETARRSESDSEYVVVRDGSGNESLVLLRTDQAKYRGALVVSRGAGNASVRLALLEAVRAVTGLPSECITVVKMG